jgi:hypothetical protein
MVAHKLDPLKVATFALLVKNGMTKTNAAKEAKIGWATVMRQLKEPTSALTIALAELGIFTGGIPSWENYKPLAQKALKDFGFFREYFFARSTSPWAEEAANKIVELLATPQEEYLVINVGPGAGKSTLFTHDIPAWILARSRDKSIMIGSASQNLANGYVNRLRTTLERTKPEKADHKLVELGLAHDAKSTLPLSYGRFRPVGAGQWSRSQFDIEQIDGQSRNEKEASVAGFGMDAGYLGGRYDFIIWDDLVTNATLRTEVAREKLISDWENQAETRLEPEGLLVLQGQRLGPNDLYRYCLNLKGVQEIDASGYDDTEVKKYHHIVFKAHYEEKCEGEHARSAKAYPQGCLLDPRRLSWQKLRTIQINKEGTFRTVYQQEDIATGDNLVEMAWIDGGADSRGYMMPGCWDEERSSGVVPQGVKGTSVITADPSVSNYWGLCLAGESMILTENGERPIKEILVGEKVITRGGYRKVLFSGKTGTKKVLEIGLSNGRTLRLTPEHRVAQGEKWIEAKDLVLGSTLTGTSMLPLPIPTVLAHTGSARPTPMRVGVKIIPRIGMSFATMSQKALRVGVSSHVLSMSLGDQVVGIDTRSHSASVADFQSFGDVSDKCDIGLAMGSTSRHRPVTASPFRVGLKSIPHPATVLVDSRTRQEVVAVYDDSLLAGVGSIATGGQYIK